MRGLNPRWSLVACVVVALTWPVSAFAGAAPFAVQASRAEAIWAVSFDTSTPAADDRAPVAFDRLRIEWSAGTAPRPLEPNDLLAGADVQASQLRPRAKAFEYSDAYNTRRKIHMYASFATAPLIATEWILGQKLYNGTGGESTRGAHAAVAASLGVLFGVNSVTGVWNMLEARKDPNRKTKRLVHGILMLAADAGFVATAAMAPDREDDSGESYGSDPSAHRAMAITSMVTALTSYVIMLVGR